MRAVSLARILMIFTAISGCFAVLFGAWLAHQGQYLSAELQHRLVTALNYQFIHTLALLVCIVWYQLTQRRSLLVSISAFALGIVCFCGSLYLKSLTHFSLSVPLAPIGGISFALAWLSLAWQAIFLKEQQKL